MRDHYDDAASLRNYRGPVAVMLAEHDRVVPAHLGQTLYDGYDGPKRIWIQHDRDHNHLDYRREAPWWREIAAFLKVDIAP